MNLTEECVIRDFQKCQKYKQEKKSGKTGQIRNDQRVMITKKTVPLIEKKKGYNQKEITDMLSIMGKMSQGKEFGSVYLSCPILRERLLTIRCCGVEIFHQAWEKLFPQD